MSSDDRANRGTAPRRNPSTRSRAAGLPRASPNAGPDERMNGCPSARPPARRARSGKPVESDTCRWGRPHGTRTSRDSTPRQPAARCRITHGAFWNIWMARHHRPRGDLPSSQDGRAGGHRNPPGDRAPDRPDRGGVRHPPVVGEIRRFRGRADRVQRSSRRACPARRSFAGHFIDGSRAIGSRRPDVHRQPQRP